MTYKTPRKRKLLTFSTPYRRNKASVRKIIRRRGIDVGAERAAISKSGSLDFVSSDFGSNASVSIDEFSNIKGHGIGDPMVKGSNKNLVNKDNSVHVGNKDKSKYTGKKDTSIYAEKKDAPMDDKKKSLLQNCKKMLKSIQTTENTLLVQLKEENSQLRDIKTNILTIKNLLGLEIIKSDDGYICSYETVSKADGIRKFIKFLLAVEGDDLLSYKLLGSENIDLPDILCDNFEFDRDMLTKFVFDIVIGYMNGWRE